MENLIKFGITDERIIEIYNLLEKRIPENFPFNFLDIDETVSRMAKIINVSNEREINLLKEVVKATEKEAEKKINELQFCN